MQGNDRPINQTADARRTIPTLGGVLYVAGSSSSTVNEKENVSTGLLFCFMLKNKVNNIVLENTASFD